MSLKILEFLEQILIDPFLIKLTQFEYTESICNFYLFRWKILNLRFLKTKLSKGNELNLQKK